MATSTDVPLVMWPRDRPTASVDDLVSLSLSFSFCLPALWVSHILLYEYAPYLSLTFAPSPYLLIDLHG